MLLLQQSTINALCSSQAECFVSALSCLGVFMATSTALKANKQKHSEKGQTFNERVPSFRMLSTNCHSLGEKQNKTLFKEWVLPKQQIFLKRQDKIEFRSG